MRFSIFSSFGEEIAKQSRDLVSYLSLWAIFMHFFLDIKKYVIFQSGSGSQNNDDIITMTTM